MKQNYLSKTLSVAGILILVASCSKDFLIVQPKGSSLETGYYKNPEEAFAALVTIYVSTATETNNKAVNWYCPKLGPLNAAADECYAGGGSSSDMLSWQVWNNYTLTAANGPQGGYWGVDFEGIYKANLLLEKINGGIPGLSDDLKVRYIAEAKFLRAYFYFELVRLFKNVPLITSGIGSSEWYGVTQAKP